MIAFNRVGSIAPGKTAAAIGFAHEIAGYIKLTYGVEPEVMMPVGGNPQRIAWSTRYKDLATMEAIQTKTLADMQYWAIVNKGIENFLPGSFQDSIWRSV